MDVETSSKKKQMFILKISWRLVCGPKSWMKGKVGFECWSSSSSRRMVTHRLSIQWKNAMKAWKLQGRGCCYSMKNITTKQTIKCLFLKPCEWIWPACHHLKPTGHSAALKPHRQLHISTRLARSWRRKINNTWKINCISDSLPMSVYTETRGCNTYLLVFIWFSCK